MHSDNPQFEYFRIANDVRIFVSTVYSDIYTHGILEKDSDAIVSASGTSTAMDDALNVDWI